jgi:hypothetical protein
MAAGGQVLAGDDLLVDDVPTSVAHIGAEPAGLPGAAAMTRDDAGFVPRVQGPGLTGLRMWPSARTRTVG